MFKKRGQLGTKRKRDDQSVENAKTSEICDTQQATTSLHTTMKRQRKIGIVVGTQEQKSASSNESKEKIEEEKGDQPPINNVQDDIDAVEKEEKERSAQEVQNEIGFTMRKKASGTSRQIKQASNLKASTFTDYQPDVCKDFKQTGFCGYGDSCKFLHSRDDFVKGWSVVRDWDITAKNKTESQLKDSSSLDLENIPFKCVICKNDYKQPVVTTCGHYFCSNCFSKGIKETPNCAVCGVDTQGVVKVATKLKKLLKQKKEE